MNRVYLSLGSNLSNPLYQLSSALNKIKKIQDSQLIIQSPLYYSLPYSPIKQPYFLNIAIAIDTSLESETLLDHIQYIEKEQGRVRQIERWGPRTLDIDIMLFGEKIINTPRLTVPHYDMNNRAFMLIPLLDIAPNLYLPNGKLLSEIIDSFDQNTMKSVMKSPFLT
ncbi:2-amino-4-hydroxy-6-hydroxymethyldihydropteridine diphosphokinase [Candidatus Erwinia haradaeae]|uniref:2-amino-4-hydroxy-6-hydroxymethyldihydropteridine pyrophosphokinase n=1 Tax=Candidatus Erwinia haradaeae TaxID=1922217 RepID=A0A803FT80_9GAMM|nr:2-amino-4-hydroxy-6-hydroxymethyldihydropteridine diphosphokinase [Candidatus Erwinia haradaeae]VFP87800.1 2-amino-4-hydroxy-6-hydroxymethyldihydropteridinepyrophosphokinase [Candidatus Erwinia haradaeae]